MAMGKKPSARQASPMWVNTGDLRRSRQRRATAQLHGIMTSDRGHAAFFIVALAVGMLNASAAAAQGDSGFYVGVGGGFASTSTLGSSVYGVNHPTRCDTLLYADPGMAPSSDPACLDMTPRVTSTGSVSPDPGFTGGFTAGYDFGRVRAEFEYRARTHGGDASLVGSSSNSAKASKAKEWNPEYPPVEFLSSYRVHQFFVNVHYDFQNDSRWTPFVGAGTGMARTKFRYGRHLLRKTIAQGYQDVDPPLTIADRPAAAASTLSLLDREVDGAVAGFQVLAGVDYALGKRTSLGLNLHWARLGDVTEDVVWSVIRSHEPVRADGVTPFSSELTFSNFEFSGLTLVLKYRF